MRIRRSSLAVACLGGLLGLLALAPAASAAPSPAARYAATATAYQNAVLDHDLAHYPGGTRISASEASWDHGALLVNVAKSPSARTTLASGQSGISECPYGYACVWAGEGFTGFYAGCPSSYIWGSTYFCPIYQVGFGVTGQYIIKSWANFTAYRAWLQERNSNTNPGNEVCLDPRFNNITPTSDSDFSGINDQDGWIYMSSNTADC
jgi:hypothetical protein